MRFYVFKTKIVNNFVHKYTLCNYICAQQDLIESIMVRVSPLLFILAANYGAALSFNSNSQLGDLSMRTNMPQDVLAATTQSKSTTNSRRAFITNFTTAGVLILNPKIASARGYDLNGGLIFGGE